ncbi:copper chaperone PCu(A)C [Rickettsia endosymbiont of Halotydeus destructor]|uniref:copper chaperone PCu(A)C n=1 Tax=Rickettsia endosymbiont of Halotydeus destructor TaxID=2996754 RepID=UPI003BAEAFDE
MYLIKLLDLYIVYVNMAYKLNKLYGIDMNLKTILLLLTTFTSSLSYADTNTSVTPTATPNDQSNSEASTIPASTELSFVNVWARPASSTTGKVGNSAMYLVIQNDTDASYNLINASSDIANKVEIHQTFTDEKGVSKMVKVDKLLIPAKTSVELKPGGAHIMLNNLKQSLKIGDEFKVSLFFDNAPATTIKVKVSDSAPTQ